MRLLSIPHNSSNLDAPGHWYSVVSARPKLSRTIINAIDDVDPSTSESSSQLGLATRLELPCWHLLVQSNNTSSSPSSSSFPFFCLAHPSCTLEVKKRFYSIPHDDQIGSSIIRPNNRHTHHSRQNAEHSRSCRPHPNGQAYVLPNVLHTLSSWSHHCEMQYA